MLLKMLEHFRERFESKAWDSRDCSKSSIERCFREFDSSVTDFATFNTLYRRAACEDITFNWESTRLEEKRATKEIASTKRKGRTCGQGVLFYTLLCSILHHCPCIMLLTYFSFHSNRTR
jgi:hypothetical protein